MSFFSSVNVIGRSWRPCKTNQLPPMYPSSIYWPRLEPYVRYLGPKLQPPQPSGRQFGKGSLKGCIIALSLKGWNSSPLHGWNSSHLPCSLESEWMNEKSSLRSSVALIWTPFTLELESRSWTCYIGTQLGFWQAFIQSSRSWEFECKFGNEGILLGFGWCFRSTYHGAGRVKTIDWYVNCGDCRLELSWHLNWGQRFHN